MAGRQYSAWYGEPAHTRLPHIDEMLFRPLDAVANTVPPASLLTSVATGAEQYLAFAILGADNLIHVVHRLLRYVPPLGQPQMPYDNLTFATFGEVSELGVTTIEVPGGFFTQTAVLPRVLTLAATTREAMAHPVDGQIAQEAAPNEDVEEVRTRKAMLIPSNLVGSILRASQVGLTPRTLWIAHVVPTLEVPGRQASTAPFIDWARVAYAGGVGGNNPVQCTPTPPPRHLDLALTEQRLAILTRDFPAVPVQPPAGDGHILATAIGGLRADMAARDESKVLRAALKRAADQRPSSRWFASTTRLLRLCHVQDEAELPPMWQAMATHGVKMDRNTIQYHLSLDMPTLDDVSASRSAPICSPELSKSLGQLTFQTSADDIQAGLHIFAVCYPTQSSRTEANRVAGLYDAKVQSIMGMTMEETVTLKAAQTFLLPVGYVELQLVCSGYHRFLGAVLGPAHPVVTAFGLFITGLKDDVPSLYPYFNDSVPRTTGILRYIQLSMYSWIRRQVMTDRALDPPRFVDIFERIEQQDWVIPTLPKPHCNPTSAETTPSANSTATTGGSSTKKSTLIMAPTNHLDALVPTNKTFDPKTFIRTHGTPPSNDKGGAMCLLYHVRGQCKQDCDRGPLQGAKNDHRRHTKTETERLAAYLRKAT